MRINCFKAIVHVFFTRMTTVKRKLEYRSQNVLRFLQLFIFRKVQTVSHILLIAHDNRTELQFTFETVRIASTLLDVRSIVSVFTLY